MAASHRILREAGVDVDIATPGGVSPTVDSLSLDERGGLAPADAEEFRTYLGGLGDDLAHPLPLAEVPSDDYDALCIPGGHAPMVDLAVDKEFGRLLNAAQARGTIVAALCHGGAALLGATDADASRPHGGSWRPCQPPPLITDQ
ncbi:DJ-1/PfpI family protein [Streptomyces violaceusniger]|uniref:DJ-1/PfpI family protein n=1 Tax=Streptomyces violaceusniger TaxID=68280 RepID=UPI0036C835E6